jgi:hypothetical protein
MTCRRSDDVDLAAFLAHEDSGAHNAFRAHYPGCEDCAAEVRVWTALHTRLASSANDPTDPHPPPELLLALEEHPNGLPAWERRRVADHLQTCAPCRDELRTLQMFDFEPLKAPAAPGWRVALGLFAARVRGVVLHPAFAYGLVALLGVASLRDFLGGPAERQLPSKVIEFRPHEETAPLRAPRELVPPARPPAAGESRQSAPQRAAAPAPTARAPAAARPAARATEPPARRADADLVARGAREPAEAGAGINRPMARGIMPRPEIGQITGAGNTPTLLLDPSAATVLAPVEPGRNGVRLQTAAPEGSTPGDEVEISVRTADGRRELRERSPADLTGALVEMVLPPAWLRPGPYRIDVRRLRPNQPAKPLAHFELTVE